MKITFLGTGTSQGVPIIGCQCQVCQSDNPKDKRLRSSILIEKNNKTIIIDTTPDFRYQMLRANVTKLDAVLFTHEHNDHIIGLDDVRPFNFRYNRDMPIYGDKRVQENLRERFAYAFTSNYPGLPRFIQHEIKNNVPFEIEGIEFIPIEVLHGKLPILGYRIGDFTYITDAKSITPNELEKIKGTKTLVLSALHHLPHYSHFTLQEALAVIEEIAPKQTYLTHMSHFMGEHDIQNAYLPKGVEFAYDGLKLFI